MYSKDNTKTDKTGCWSNVGQIHKGDDYDNDNEFRFLCVDQRDSMIGARMC